MGESFPLTIALPFSQGRSDEGLIVSPLSRLVQNAESQGKGVDVFLGEIQPTFFVLSRE